MEKCKFVHQFLCSCSYSDALDEVCVAGGNRMGQAITQQEVDSK